MLRKSPWSRLKIVELNDSARSQILRMQKRKRVEKELKIVEKNVF